MALTHTQIGIIIASCASAVILLTLLILFLTRHHYSFTFSRRPNPTTTPDIEMQDISPSSRPPSGEFTQYGNLTIPPGRRPVAAVLDIINSVFMWAVIPPGTKAVSEPQVSLRPTSMTPSQFTSSVIEEAETSGHALDVEREALRKISIARQQVREQAENEARELKHKAKAFLASQVLERNDPGAASELPPLPPFDFRHTECGSRFIEQFSPRSEVADTKLALADVFVVGRDEEADDIEIAVDPMSGIWGTGKGMAALYYAK